MKQEHIYNCDAWGNSKITYHSGSLNSSVNNNPFRYRGYYYDADFGLYYLQTRYYDSNTGRFINADGYVSTGQGILGNNMFAYCNNNPVMFVDPDGKCSKFLGFLWKVDCKQASCPTSKNYIEPKGIDPTSTYNNGRGYVYIITLDQLGKFQNVEDNVVVIIDYRTAEDPNMQILNSYKIKKRKLQNEIAQIMLDYNGENPVSPAWSRTSGSIVEEWEAHNLAYIYLKFLKSPLFINARDCDFNNGHEGYSIIDFVKEYF